MRNIKFSFLFLLFAAQVQAQITNITGPAGSGQYGKTVAVLTNGNFVVTDPQYDDGAIADVGAVYLYNGITHSLISTLKGSSANDSVGSNGITTLNNGNFLVHSPSWNNGANADAGAITWCNGTTGLSGIVSSSNSLAGSNVNDNVGGPYALANLIVLLNNGNYLVRSPNWNNKAGAVTWVNGTMGVTGIISSSNSLVGNTANDQVGGTTVLNNGNYIVTSSSWDNGTATDAGAVTWGSGTTGISGVVSSSNSLVGSSANDHIGWNGIKVLSNDNYIVISTNWDNGPATDAGAVTWGSGTTGIWGVVGSSNSLVGSSVNDLTGNGGVKVLSNNNYVVISYYWDNGSATDGGAVTWGNGTTGISGTVNSINSLVGTATNNWVGIGGITVLSNGNYVVISSRWDNGSAADAGAVTWGNGTTGISGTVSSSNSLVGSSANDQIGGGGETLSTVVALNNGNYVVNSPYWNNGTFADAGAVTWCNGTTGLTGVISSSNSLVGSYHTGGSGIITLSNGNYVVMSPEWRNGALTNVGAATWANGTTGITGNISSSNSLVGSTANDQVGRAGPLSNGNYVVISSSWDNGTVVDAGAATFCNGTTGNTGIVSSSNSLVGSTANDRVGASGIIALSNSNYVVVSPFWNNGGVSNAGAITWGNGTTGITGIITSSNSLVGSTIGDNLGGQPPRVTSLTNGNYVVISSSWNQGKGAITWGNGNTGVSGIVSSNNSLVGSNSIPDHVGDGPIIVLSNNNYVVSSPIWGNFAGAVSWGNGSTGTSGIVSSGNSLVGSKANDMVGSVIAEADNNYVVSSPAWDYGAVPDAGAVSWGNSVNGVAGNITSCNSVIGAKSFANNNIYGYLIAGRPSENIVSIFSPVALTLAGTLDTISTNINGLTATPLIASGGCRIITTLTPNGTSPVSGLVNTRVWIESTVPVYNGYPFVARHYEITPATNASAATGRITLYFTQQEFNDFNDHSGSTSDLPTGDGDAVGKANLRIWKFPGTSSDGSGLPATYSGSAVLINPNDNDIVWNSNLGRWEVSFDVTGFSGFFVHTNSPVVPLALLGFSGRLINNNAVLNWKTTDEINTFSFDIERSSDIRNYSTVGNVAAVNQPGNHQYNYTDNNIISLGVPVIYYRLKLKDMDGRFTYSKIVVLSVDNSKSIVLLYPNPVINEAYLLITINEAGPLQGRIIDNAGRLVKQQQWNLQSGSASLPVDVSRLANGIYYLELRGKKINGNLKFVKQ